jgi:glycosyltransferase involved in cell wall biosynthesis
LEADIRAYIDKLDLDRLVTVHVPPTDASSVYQNAHVFLSTSLFEGVSNTILEAMNHRLPVIATDVGDSSRLVEHGKSGFLFNVERAGDAVDYLLQLVDAPEVCTDMGRRGSKRLVDEFSLEKFGERYEAFVKSERSTRSLAEL